MLDGVKISAVSEDVIFLCCDVVWWVVHCHWYRVIHQYFYWKSIWWLWAGTLATLVLVIQPTLSLPPTYWCSCNLYTANTQPATYLKMLPEHWHWLPYAANTVNAIFKKPISVWKFILRYYVYINITYILRRVLPSAIKDKFCLFRNNITVPCHLPS